MAIKLTKQSSGSVVVPLSGKVQIFVDSSDGALKIKDDTNTVTPVGGGGGGLTRDPTVRTANFSAAADTSYLVATQGSLLTVTLPAVPANGTKVEIIAITGDGGPLEIDPNGGAINIFGTTVGLPVQFYSQNCHFVFEYSTADSGGRWTETQNGANSYFGSNSGSALANSVVISNSAGSVIPNTLSNNTVLGRFDTDFPGLSNLSLPVFVGLRKTLTSPFSPTGSLTDITDLTFTPDYTGWSTFDFYVPLKLAAGTGAFTLAVNYTSTSSEFTVGGTIASSSTVATYVHTGTVGAGLTGATQSAGTFVARLAGSIFTTGPGNLVLRASCTNTTDSGILTGAWGAVHRGNMFP